MKKIKHCPCCKSKEVYFVEEKTKDGIAECIECSNCGLHTGLFKHRRHSLFNWNTRGFIGLIIRKYYGWS